jgi:hypothetical protein
MCIFYFSIAIENSFSFLNKKHDVESDDENDECMSDSSAESLKVVKKHKVKNADTK